MTTILDSYSEKDTEAIAEDLARKSAPSDVFALVGDLGVGKTAFAKGFARGLDIDEPIVSPTFTIVQIYEGGKMPLYHFDVYRLGDESEMDEIGYEDCFYGEGVSLVEWADTVRSVMPQKTVWITVEKDLTRGTDYRRITIDNDEDYRD